jgi:sensor histidine kinase regulating citrate/malate metabolism
MLAESWVEEKQVIEPRDSVAPRLAVAGQDVDDALVELVHALKLQAHEYANRIHTISGLLALGMNTEARELLDGCICSHQDGDAAVAEAIGVPALAGLIVVKRSAARAAGVEFGLDQGSSLEELPPRLSELDSVSLLGNLLDNATEEASRQPPGSRAVELTIFDLPDAIRILVRDSGLGLSPADQFLFEAGQSTKGPGRGYGLAVVGSILAATGGSLRCGSDAGGTTVEASIPR